MIFLFRWIFMIKHKTKFYINMPKAYIYLVLYLFKRLYSNENAVHCKLRQGPVVSNKPWSGQVSGQTCPITRMTHGLCVCLFCCLSAPQIRSLFNGFRQTIHTPSKSNPLSLHSDGRLLLECPRKILFVLKSRRHHYPGI